MPTLNSLLPEERVRAIAYTLWLKEGRPEGRAEAHWMKANELASAEVPQPDSLKKPAAAPKKAQRRKSS